MNYKKFTFPALITSALLFAGCTPNDEEVSKEKDPIVEKDATISDEVTDTETNTEKETTKEPVVEENDENTAVTVVNTYFEGINEENLDKIKSVYDNEKILESYKELFATLDINTEVVSYEVMEQNGNEWELDFKVKFSSKEQNVEYTDNITTYLIKVDSSTKKIIYLELIASNEI